MIGKTKDELRQYFIDRGWSINVGDTSFVKDPFQDLSEFVTPSPWDMANELAYAIHNFMPQGDTGVEDLALAVRLLADSGLAPPIPGITTKRPA